MTGRRTHDTYVEAGGGSRLFVEDRGNETSHKSQCSRATTKKPWKAAKVAARRGANAKMHYAAHSHSLSIRRIN